MQPLPLFVQFIICSFIVHSLLFIHLFISYIVVHLLFVYHRLFIIVCSLLALVHRSLLIIHCSLLIVCCEVYIVLLRIVLVPWHLRYSHFSAVADMALLFGIRRPRASLLLRFFKWIELNVPSTFSQMYLRVLWLWLYPKIWMLWRPNRRCNDLFCQLSVARTLD